MCLHQQLCPLLVAHVSPLLYCTLSSCLRGFYVRSLVLNALLSHHVALDNMTPEQKVDQAMKKRMTLCVGQSDQ